MAQYYEMFYRVAFYGGEGFRMATRYKPILNGEENFWEHLAPVWVGAGPDMPLPFINMGSLFTTYTHAYISGCRLS